MRLRRTALVVIVALVGITAVVGMAMATGGLGRVSAPTPVTVGPVMHDAGSGPLSTHLEGRSDQVLALDPVNAGKTFSVATPLCVLTGGPVTLTGAGPLDTLGTSSDWTFLGAKLQVTPPGGAEAFLGTDGFPPTTPDGELSDVEGSVVSSPCAEDSAGRTDALLGFSSSKDSHGGGWTSTRIDYRQGGKQYALVVHDTWVLCGTAAASVSECASYASAP